MRAEWGARLLVVFGTVALAVLTAVAVRVPAGAVELRGRMADDGGWTPGAIVTRVGEPLTLRMTSDDVVHGFAIGQSARPAVDLLPGTWMTTTLIFDRPGKYTYYCTRWCGPNHWRMRGTIEVTGSGARVLADSVPLFLRLKLDLDQAHPCDALPAETPTAARADGLPSPVAPDGGDLRTQSPAQVWRALRKHPVNARLTDQQLWDEVAAVWRAATSRERLAQGGQLYRDNCAACHGETGRGDGVMAKALMAGTAADPPGGEHTGMLGMSGHGTVAPTDFTNGRNMLGASAAFLQGKIIRGGMGTGMPYWGPIFTESQLWALVDHLWTFQFDYESGAGSSGASRTTRDSASKPAMRPH